MRRFSLIAVSALLASTAVASPLKGPSRICDGAVSAAACADHKAYLASAPFYGNERDTSPVYMKRLDARYNSSMLDAGNGGAGGGGDAGGSAP